VSVQLDLLDWKRRVFELYAEVRATPDPEAAWHRWRDVRAELFRMHPQSPSPGYDRLDYFPYDPSLRLAVDVEPADGASLELEEGTFHRFGRIDVGVGTLDVFWLEGYGGGLFLPFADGLRGRETYGGGRYLLDTVKGSDLGRDGERLVVDFNFAYNPSCAYDPRWVCPLAPPGNRLDAEIRAGERFV
jgi:uncharacterized protein